MRPLWMDRASEKQENVEGLKSSVQYNRILCTSKKSTCIFRISLSVKILAESDYEVLRLYLHGE